MTDETDRLLAALGLDDRLDEFLTVARTLRNGGIERAQVAVALREMAAARKPPVAEAELERVLEAIFAPAERPRKRTQSDALVELAQDAELLHTAFPTPYARILVGGHFETWALRSAQFRSWLSRQFYAVHGRVPGDQSIRDALGVLSGQALFEAPEAPVYVRIAEHEGAVYVDLADDDWRAIQIDAKGWRIIDDPPVRFRRARGMLALPEPVRGGSIDELYEFLNLRDDEQYVLFAATLLAAFRPSGPFPVPIFWGEPGTGKSSASRIFRDLLDPNEAPLRGQPKDERDLVIAATNGCVIALDNLSSLPEWLSDAICRLSTGGGFGTRELYSDDEERLFNVKRPVLLNGIAPVAERSDLLDRSVTLVFHLIQPEKRLTERDFAGRFQEARARILGALLDGVAGALRRLDEVELDTLPRLADVAEWVTAAEPALGWPNGTFMRAYAGNIAAGNELALEASPLAGPIRRLAERGGFTTTTYSLLLDELETLAEERERKHRKWPKDGSRLSGELRRLAPNLRAIGITVDVTTGHRKTKTIRLSLVPKSTNGGAGGAGGAKSATPSPFLPLTPHFSIEKKEGESREVAETAPPLPPAPPEAALHALVLAEPGLRVPDARSRLGLPVGDFYAALDELAARGLVERRRDESDNTTLHPIEASE